MTQVFFSLFFPIYSFFFLKKKEKGKKRGVREEEERRKMEEEEERKRERKVCPMDSVTPFLDPLDVPLAVCYTSA